MYQLCPQVGRKSWVHDYFVRRFYRIAPLYYAMIPINIVPLYVLNGTWPSGGTILANLLFVFGLIPNKMPGLVLAGWSVGVEMIFYALLPIFVLTIRRLDVAGGFLIASLVLGSLASNPVLSEGYQTWVPGMNFFGHLRWFACGIFGYLAYIRLHKINAPKILVARVGAITCIIAATCHVLFVEHIVVRDITIAIFLTSVCIWQSYAPSSVMCARFPQYWADRSYSIYLLHSPIMLGLKPVYAALLSHTMLVVAVIVGCCISFAIIFLCADISFRLIELPGMKLGRKFSHAGS
jgi:peptidoglycan/LPS O-acetylase OafA/YrhL